MNVADHTASLVVNATFEGIFKTEEGPLKTLLKKCIWMNTLQ